VRAEAPPLRAARLARAVAVHDAALREVVRRHFEVDAVARQDLDAMPTEAAGDMRKDRLSVFEFDRERRARKDLLDRPEEFQRRFFSRLFRRAGPGLVGVTAAAARYGRTSFVNVIWISV